MWSYVNKPNVTGGETTQSVIDSCTYKLVSELIYLPVTLSMRKPINSGIEVILMTCWCISFCAVSDKTIMLCGDYCVVRVTNIPSHL